MRTAPLAWPPTTLPRRPLSAFSFRQWASDLGLARFADSIGEAGLADLIDTSMTPLTIFAPTDDAVARLGSQRPGEAEQLRELMCVHLVSTGQLCSTELLTTKSITTIGQQTHHVTVLGGLGNGAAGHGLQVGPATLVQQT